MNPLEQTLKWFELAIPMPTEDNVERQAECIEEEFNELFEAEDDLDELDALADIIVTCVGLAYMRGYDIVGALREVNESNFSKFENGVPLFDSTGKIKKGKDYVPPDLTPYLANDDIEH